MYNKKLDKIMRDTIREINSIPSFGYGQDVDALARTAIMSYHISVLNIASLETNIDHEILSQNILDEMLSMHRSLANKLKILDDNKNEQ